MGNGSSPRAVPQSFSMPMRLPSGTSRESGQFVISCVGAEIEGKSNQMRIFALKQLVRRSWEEYKVIQVGETRVYSSEFARGVIETPPRRNFSVIIIPCDSTERLTRMLPCRGGSVWSNLPCSERSVDAIPHRHYFRHASCHSWYCSDRLRRRDRREGGQAYWRYKTFPADPAERAQRGRKEGNWPG